MTKTSIAVLFAFVFSSEAAAQQSYLMACRSATAGPASLESKNGVLTLSVLFTKASAPGDQVIPEGTCTWMDRVINSQEPRKLSYDLPAGQPFSMLINFYGNTSMTTGSQGAPGFNSIVEALSALRYYGYMKYFYVYNVENRFFKVVKVGP